MAKDDKLHHYRAKRDFSITSEPEGQVARRGQALSFVIQKHAARRLHYDFRLELDGTLKSWAVPKGPSLDPADKRMAVHVEDHPLAYGGFEGVIPAGQYGAGTVIVWDRGEWVPHGDPLKGYREGKLKFELRGDKLQGHWTLVRMRGRAQERQEPWLLIKERDEAARPAAELDVVEALPDSVLKLATRHRPTRSRAPRAKASAMPLTQAPQLATLVDKVPSGGDWLYEIKFDGYRLLARIDHGVVRLFTRNGHDWTSRLKAVARELSRLDLRSGWLDGEIVVIGSHGGADFQALQNAFDNARTDPVQYFVFDLLDVDGEDLREHPLQQRRERLRSIIEQGDRVDAHPHVRYSEDFEVAPEHLLHTACAMRMEGVIGKRRDAPYRPGRGDAWIKLKCTQRQEFVVGGYTDPKGARHGLGALLLGVHDEQGQLRYAGHVGTGFDAHALKDLHERLTALAVSRPAFAELPRDVKGHWVKPKLVAEVSFAQWTKEGRLRQAVFHGLRTDKPPRAITREKAMPPPALEGAAGSRKVPGKTVGKIGTVESRVAGIRITHADRVIDPSTGITKGELADYHARIARRMLPHLAGRPVSLVRAPEGIEGELFFQKHADRMSIPGIERLDTALDPGHAPLLAVPSREALAGVAQMNVIELHTWNATTDHIEQPDRMTFDLDPGEGVPWSQVQEAAALVRVMLEELSLRSFLKTSGGKGLHVVVPFKPSLGWGEVKALSKAIVEHLAATLPDRFVSKSGPRNRVGKIFVDYLRNGRGATTAAAWTVRARPGMGVSVPVDWAELPRLRSGAHWTLRTIDERMAQADPWAGYRRVKQSLREALKAMG